MSKADRSAAAREIDNLVQTGASYWSAGGGQVHVPIFPSDDLGGVGRLPNTPRVPDEVMPTISAMTALGPSKPRMIRCTDRGSMMVAQSEGVQLASQVSGLTTIGADGSQTLITVPLASWTLHDLAVSWYALSDTGPTGFVEVDIAPSSGSVGALARQYALVPAPAGAKYLYAGQDRWTPILPVSLIGASPAVSSWTVAVTQTGGVALAVFAHVQYAGLPVVPVTQADRPTMRHAF